MKNEFYVHLFDSIPTTDFLGLENKEPITQTGKSLIELLEYRNQGRFIVPSIVPKELDAIFCLVDDSLCANKKKLSQASFNDVIYTTSSLPLGILYEDLNSFQEIDLYSICSIKTDYLCFKSEISIYDLKEGKIVYIHPFPKHWNVESRIITPNFTQDLRTFNQ